MRGGEKRESCVCQRKKQTRANPLRGRGGKKIDPEGLTARRTARGTLTRGQNHGGAAVVKTENGRLRSEEREGELYTGERISRRMRRLTCSKPKFSHYNALGGGGGGGVRDLQSLETPTTTSLKKKLTSPPRTFMTEVG